ncbi:MAG: hypothetical protein RSE13_23320 [Planktothrix sp. GU0601_MAG3]|nr:MAG: hypothetical protein RSE13_23320 [Planktothrix sp. GU0601_MAG3]
MFPATIGFSLELSVININGEESKVVFLQQPQVFGTNFSVQDSVKTLRIFGTVCYEYLND